MPHRTAARQSGAHRAGGATCFRHPRRCTGYQNICRALDAAASMNAKVAGERRVRAGRSAAAPDAPARGAGSF
jgi:hypothetical protein